MKQKMTDDWKEPTNLAKIRKLSGTATPLNTQNRFEIVSQSDNTNADQISKTTPVSKSPKAPPIYVYGIQNKFQFSSSLSAACRIKSLISHTQQYVRL